MAREDAEVGLTELAIILLIVATSVSFCLSLRCQFFGREKISLNR